MQGNVITKNPWLSKRAHGSGSRCEEERERHFMEKKDLWFRMKIARVRNMKCFGIQLLHLFL